MRNWLFLLVICASGISPEISFGASKELADWKRLCAEFSSEDSAIRQSAKNETRKITDLSSKLHEAMKIEERRNAALCIITKMKMKEFLPDLIQLASSSSQSSAVTLSRRVWFALRLFAGPESKAVLDPLARKWIHETSSPKNLLQRVSSIRILSKLNSKIETPLLLKLLADPLHKVKVVAMDHFKTHLPDYTQDDQRKIFAQAIASHPYQLRLQALSYYHSLSPQMKSSMQANLKKCAEDPVAEVRSKCRR